MVAANILRLRKANLLSQEELAGRIGRHRNRIQQIEAPLQRPELEFANLTLEMLEDIATGLGVEVTDLLAAPLSQDDSKTAVSLRHFLDSDEARRAKITEPEKERLAKLELDFGAPSIRGWAFLLEGIRDAATDET